MEMTAVWEERKSKSPFPLFPHGLGKLPNTASFPHSHSFDNGLDSFFLQARLTSTSTKVLPTCPVPSVTDIPVRSTKRLPPACSDLPLLSRSHTDSLAPALRHLVHLHPRHNRVVHIVVSLIVIVCGPDFPGVAFIRVYMDHPSEYMGMKFSARCFTGFFAGNRAH
jgi:hypothetical protein